MQWRLNGLLWMGWLVVSVGACSGGSGDGTTPPPDDGIDRRSCEDTLIEVAQFPKASDAELVRVGDRVYYLGVESESQGEGQPTVWEARLAAVDTTLSDELWRTAVPLAADTFDAEIMELDGRMVMAAVGQAHFDVTVLNTDGDVESTVNLAQASSDFVANVEMLPDAAGGVLLAVIRAPSILDAEATLEIHRLAGAEADYAPLGEPILLASREDGRRQVDMLAPLQLVPPTMGWPSSDGVCMEGDGSSTETI
jgi:hypothetical protein